MERDRTGRAVASSAKLAANIVSQVLGVVNIGPGNVRMSPEELRREVKNMRGEPLLRMAEMLGNEEVLSALRNK